VSIKLGNRFIKKAPRVRKIKWVNARNTITIGNPAKKKPRLEPSVTNMAVAGEINIAINNGI
jgi:hypothetical protein